MPPHTRPDRIVDFDQLQKITGARYIPYLEFDSFHTLKKVAVRKRIRLTPERLWLSAYFKEELLKGFVPKVSVRWTDDKIGWGLFAERDFQTMEFIAEYSGLVRARSKKDSKNAYCFEYLLIPDEETPYLIDAQDQGGISRYINHHPNPNLSSTFTLIEEIPHVILYTCKSIKKGEQLCFDYGPDYWKKRSPPRV
jgi:hypothetical protein